MKKIAVLDDYQRVALSFAEWSRLDGRAEITVFHDHIGEFEPLVARLQDFDAVCLMRERTPFPAALFERLPNLKLLITTGMANASVDAAAAARHGIVFCGTGGSGHATAELTISLILSLARGLPAEMASLAAGGWQVGVGRELAGARLGILGLGRLGSRLAEYGKVFGMDVVAWSQNLTPEAAAQKGARHVSKEELFSTSDYISIHLKLSDRTVGLVGSPEFALMKRDACLVNTSRGPIVDQDALIAALKEGRIGGAALDVYDEEPLPAGHPLRAAPNLIMTPHIGYVSRQTYRVFYGQTLENIEAWLDGKPVRVIGA